MLVNDIIWGWGWVNTNLAGAGDPDIYYIYMGSPVPASSSHMIVFFDEVCIEVLLISI